MFFESYINNFRFRYEGGTTIDVSKRDDKNHTVLYEIGLSEELNDEKTFQKEISWWFMANGNMLH